MELIPINESKLKIMLDESDMKEYNIGDEADCANNETRLAIRTILDKAKTMIGFNTEGSEIFVQLYTSKGGGCELFVTKSSFTSVISDVSCHDGKPTKKRNRKRDDQSQKRSTTEGVCNGQTTGNQTFNRRAEYGRMIFSFESLKDICTVCRILNKMPHELSSLVFRGENEAFYLVLENTNMSAYSRLDKLTFILEYGKRERADHVNTYLNEHGKLICPENAISTLAKF